MASWKTIIEYGVKPEMDELEKNRVILTNKTGLITAPIIAIPFTGTLLSFNAPVIIIITLWSICLLAFLTPWVSKYLSANIAKVLGIIEFNFGTLTISLMTTNGKQPVTDFLLTVSTAMLSCIIPILFYAPYQKKQRILGILFAWICFVAYIPLSKILYLPTAPSLKPQEYYLVGISGFSVAIFIISLATGYIQRLDITTLRNYIRKVEENEARLEEAQSIARLGTWEYCFETDTLIWSDQLYRNTGIPVGTPLTLKEFNEKMLPEEDRVKLNEAIHIAVTQTGTFDVEHRMYNAKHEIMWIMAKGKVIYDDTGKPFKLLGTARDFTQEKLSDLVIEQQNRELQAREEELRQNLEELQATQEQMRLYQHDLEEKNRAMEELTEKLEDLVEERTQELVVAKEAAEVAQKQAEQANKVKSDFLSNMSHELRTPLNGILGYAQILMNDNSISEKHKEKLQIINKSGEHLLGLINDILDLSKIEAGKMELHYAETDLHALVQEIYDLFKLRCENKGLQLIVEKDPQLPKYVRTDTGKLRQCIINFMGNAVKFTQKGSITFSVNKGFNGNIRFAVKDTGRGIPKDKIGEMTKPFTQIYNAQNTEGGTGLGLAITKSYIELMGGFMHIESELNAGSTFSFSLPFEIVEQPVQILQKSTRKVTGIKNQATPKILIVDDSQINVDVANEFLQSVGFITEKAYNGKEAVEKYHSFNPDLILMDIRMPVMNGFEATKEIRKNSKPNLKVVAVTADAFEHQKHEIIQSGLDDYIAKPYTASQLFEVIAKNLELEYVYESEDTDTSVQETTFNIDELDLSQIQEHISDTWVTEVEKSLLMGNMEQLSTVIQSLPDQDSTVRQVKKYLLQQIEDFNDLAIENFIKKVKQTV